MSILTAHDIIMSLARKHYRLFVQIVKDFTQAKLDSEKNARFLLKKQGNLHFLLHELIKIA